MRDDERYPTVVAGPETAPEVATTAPIDLEGRDKVVYENPEGLIPVQDATVKDDASKGAGDIRGGGAPEITRTAERRICGLKRKTFFIFLGVAAVVVIAAIVGGVVGGLKAGSKSDSGSPERESNITSGPIDADQRCMAAAIATKDKKQNTQVFFNDLDTTTIKYRRVHNDKGTSSSSSLNLTIEPNWGAPLAAAARMDSDTIITDLYYMTTDNNQAQIARAVLDCGAIDSTADCSVSSNDIISSDLSSGVHTDSKLAALHLSNDSMRVYFQATKANIWVMYNDNGNWSGSNVVGAGIDGTYIASAAENKTNLHVFYVANSTERLAYVNYSDILGGGDSEIISNSPGSSWSPSNAFSSVYVPGFESYRLYYTNPSTGNIVSYFMNTTQTWRSNHDDNWGKPDSSIASVAWSDKVRLFYFQNSKLVMSSQDDSVWSKPEELGS